MNEVKVTGSLQEIWISALQGPAASCAYNESFTIQLKGKTDLRVLENSLLLVVKRHDALSATFSNDGTVMRKGEWFENTVVKHDIRNLDDTQRSEYLSRILDQEAEVPFDLEIGPLWRAHLLILSNDRLDLVFTAHHLVCDGWSINILVREIGLTYNHLLRELPLELAEPVSYFSFINNTEQTLNSERRKLVVDFWKKQLTPPLPVLDLPVDHIRPPQRTYNARSKRTVVDQKIIERIRRSAIEAGCNPFAYLLGAYATLIHKLSGSEDIVVGVPVAGQNYNKNTTIVGHCVTMLPVRITVTPDIPFTDFAATLQDNLFDAFENYELTFGDLIKELNVPRDPSRVPLIPVGFTYAKMHTAGEFGFDGLDATCVINNRHFETFEIYVTIIDYKDSLELLWHFNSDLFDDSTAGRWLEEYKVLLQGIAKDSGVPVIALPVLTESERTMILESWNATDRPFNLNETVVTMFEKQVALTPESIALEFQEKSLSYKELNERADTLASYLMGKGIGPGDTIGFCLDRSFEMVISMMGILKSGAAYIPIDPSFPDDRIRFILSDGNVQLLIADSDLNSRFLDSGVPVITLQGMHDVRLERSGKVALGKDVAYIIYTSGSTGKPKGVEIRHFSLANFLLSMIESPGMNRNDSLLAVTTVSFDIAGLELLCPLICGARVYIAEKELASDGIKLARLVNEKKPSMMQATPATWNILFDAGWNNASSMKILCGGEAMTRTLADRLLATGAEVWNMYGPTETTIWSSVWKVTPGQKSPPIGKPIANTHLHILDSRMSPLPIGAIGELYISGIGLARGYHNRSELTEEKFVHSHFFSYLYSEIENRIYKTGDIARRLADGSIEVLGRSDFQVKIRGFRIELGEIEAALVKHPAIRECVVIDSEDFSGNKILIAYIVLTDNTTVSNEELRTTLRRSLPEYMLPSQYIQLQSIPRLLNNKIDRKALPQPNIESKLSGDRALPRSQTEYFLVATWEEVLGINKISIDDNFFNIGGHSLLAAQVCARVRKVLGVELSLQNLFETPTIIDLAHYIDSVVSGEKQSQKALSPITVVDRGTRLLLSPAQQRLWFLHQINPLSPAYNIVQAFRITGTLNVSTFQNAINRLIVRHESLRMVFREDIGVPFILIKPAEEIQSGMAPLQVSENHFTYEEVSDFIRTEATRPFDLVNGPLFKLFLFTVGPGDYICTVIIHHIITDGWSAGIILRDLYRCYQGERSSSSPLLPELPLQYVDYSQWQYSQKDSEWNSFQREYWREKLGGELPVLQMPLDFDRPSTISNHGSDIRFRIPENIVRNLSRLSNENNVTVFMSLFAGFAVILNRYTGQNDIIIGTPVANRRDVALENLIGFFVNTLAIRLNIDSSISFRDLLIQVRNTAFEAFRYQDIQFDELVKILQLPRDMSYNPVFQTMFSYQNYPMSPVGNDDITFKPEWIGRAAAQFDFAFFLWDQGGEIEGVVEFSTELFSRTTMEQLASRYISLLESLTNAPENRIGEFPLITKAERQTIISTWNATNRLFQDSLCLHELITRQAQEIPESIAIKFEDISLSYRELDEQSNALAHILREAGVVAEMPVGIMTQRSAGMILSQLAILKAGGAYVPLDPNYPPERIAFMLEDASITVVITESAVANLPQTVKTRILLDTIDLASVLYNKAPLTPLSGPDNAAYIIYTSGSTGKPKGVVIQHRSVVNFACSMVQEPGINSQDAVLALTTISFDISILELLVPLTAGAKVIIVSREVATDGIMLAKKISEEGITVMQGTPSTWRLLLSGGWSGAAELKALCGGEAFPPDLFKELYPKVGSVWNMYGPTETTVWSTCCRLTDTDTTISIGKPIANTCIYILDKFLNPVPVGLTGELYIGGQGVARCYLNRTELTDQRFIPDPFVSEPHAKMYATGDLARWLHNGTIECLGRIDAQVKIRGFRIELGEIENCISSYPGVRQSAALCKEFSPGDIRLLLYYVLHTAGSITASDLRKHLRSFLPDYMIPQHFIELETMPLTPSGKIDRKALQPPIEIAGSNSSVKTLPATPGELYLATVWKEVLGIDKVHTADTFFDLGGHSLLSIQVISRIKAETGVDVQPRSLMLNTLAEIAVSYPLNDHKINNEAYRKKSIASKLFRFIRPGKKQ